MNEDRRKTERRRGINGVSPAQHLATIILVAVLFGLGWLAGHYV